MTHHETRPPGGQGDHDCCYHVAAARSVLADRERELLALKGPCGTRTCRLHYAHSGPCDCRPATSTSPHLLGQAAPDADPVNRQLRQPVATQGVALGRAS